MEFHMSLGVSIYCPKLCFVALYEKSCSTYQYHFNISFFHTQDGRLRPDDQLISINGVKLTGMSNSSAMKTLRSAMLEKMWGSVEVTIIRSAKEIMESFNDLHKIGEQNTSKDRAIDIGVANDKFGISRGTANSIEEFGKKEKLKEDGNMSFV